jgi:hypothetical protein
MVDLMLGPAPEPPPAALTSDTPLNEYGLPLPPGRKLSDEEHEALADRMEQHTQMVLAGQLPTDSPPDFVPPANGENATGQPWWWGDDFRADEAKQIMDTDRDENAPT